MAKSRKSVEQSTLPLEPAKPPAPPPMPQIGDRVIPERSDSEWKITSVRSEGRYVDLELPGTYLTRLHVDVASLKFIDRLPPKRSEPAPDTSAIFERIAIVQRDNLQRLDDDIEILKKYLKTEAAPKAVIDCARDP